jgi:hypothetical protein
MKRGEQFWAARKAQKELTYGYEVVDHNYPSKYLDDFGYGEDWKNMSVRQPLLDIYYAHRNGGDIEHYVDTFFANPNDTEGTRPRLTEEGRKVFEGYVSYLLQKPTEAIPTITEEELEAALAGEPIERSRDASARDMEELSAAIKSALRNNHKIDFELEQRLGQFDFTDEQIEELAKLINDERATLGIVDTRRH